MNFVQGTVDGSRFVASDDAFTVPLGGLSLPSGRRAVMGARPEDIAVGSAEGAATVLAGETQRVTVRARIDLIEPLGNETFVHTTAGSHAITARSTTRDLPAVESVVTLTVDPSRLHWFDLESGERL